MTLDEIMNSPDYLRGQTLKYLQRRKAGDLERAKYFLDRLIALELQDGADKPRLVIVH